MGLVLTGATLIDGTGSDPETPAAIVVEQKRIVAVGSHRTSSADDVELDLSGLTVLPGLIDLHTHLGGVVMGPGGFMSLAEIAGHLFRNAELCLMSGHTTAREVGGADGGLKQAIAAGLVTGPRLFPSGPMICQSGGHGDWSAPWSLLHSHEPGNPGLVNTSVVCDGPDEVRVAARRAFKQGATQLKMCLSGGVISFTDNIEDTQFSVAELVAAVQEAAARDTYVTAHAHTAHAVLNGLEAGLACFEHGTFLDEPTVIKMADAGAALVPTLTVLHVLATDPQAWSLPDAMIRRAQGFFDGMVASVKLARDAGVRIGSGTDLLGREQNRRGLELVLKAAAIGPMDAIVSATSASAAVLRKGDELGSVEVGKLADLIAVDFDPLTEPELFEHPDRVVLVVKNGVVEKDSRA